MEKFLNKRQGRQIFFPKVGHEVLIVDHTNLYQYVGTIVKTLSKSFEVSYYGRYAFLQSATFKTHTINFKLTRHIPFTLENNYFARENEPFLTAHPVGYESDISVFLEVESKLRILECYADVPRGAYSHLGVYDMLKLDLILEFDRKVKKLKEEVRELEQRKESLLSEKEGNC